MKNVLPICFTALMAGVASPLAAQPSLRQAWTSKAGDVGLGYNLPGQTSINFKLGLRSGFDFDGDGAGEFITMLQSSDLAATRNNNAYLFEADGNNNYTLRWSYQFTNLTGRGNGIAAGDLDGDGNQEIICLLQRDPALDNLFVFEYDPATKTFPAAPTASWNTPRAPDGRFRAEVDIKIFDLDHDGRQEMILIAFDGLVIASLSSANLNNQPQFVSEYENFTELQWILATAIADLDNNGSDELICFSGYGLGPEYYFRIVETLAPGLYTVATSLNNGQVPEQLGCYSAMLTADLDGNKFPEIYYTDTNGNLRAIVLNGNYLAITPDKFHRLGSVGGEVLTMTAVDKKFYLATSGQRTVYSVEYLGGAVTDSTKFKLTPAFAISDPAGGVIFKFAGGKDLDGDRLPDYVMAVAGHDSTKPTLYVLEGSGATAVSHRLTQQPEDYDLAQNYPNPFNPGTTIEFSLPLNKLISLRIYDNLGREVRTLIAPSEYVAGKHAVVWDGKDNSGQSVSSGQYIYRLEFGGFVKSKIMTLLK